MDCSAGTSRPWKAWRQKSQPRLPWLQLNSKKQSGNQNLFAGGIELVQEPNLQEIYYLDDRIVEGRHFGWERPVIRLDGTHRSRRDRHQCRDVGLVSGTWAQWGPRCLCGVRSIEMWETIGNCANNCYTVYSWVLKTNTSRTLFLTITGGPSGNSIENSKNHKLWNFSCKVTSL